MIYAVYDSVNNRLFKFAETDLAGATAKLAEVRAAFIAQEAYRFAIAKEIVNGNDTTWLNADLDNDPENHVYNVFNTFTGQHERMTSLSAAKVRIAELKEKLLTDVGYNKLELVDDVQPRTTGSQTL